MTTPDYLQQVVISGRRRTASSPGATGVLSPSVTGMIWAGFDFLTALVVGLIAYRIRLIGDVQVVAPEPGVVVHLVAMSAMGAVLYLLLFGVYLVFFSRVYGLYTVGQNQSGLHEMRMTVQATLTAGLLLCGTLYVMHGYALSRVIVTLTVLLTMLMLMVRRGVWRKLRQRRFLQGLETRNVLIVGDGRVGHALRNHLEALRHMGFRFKGFVSVEPRREDPANTDVVGDVGNCVALARALFVDEIYFSTPLDKRTVVAVVRGTVAGDRCAGGAGFVRWAGVECAS